uniref:Uncharacterized protein n=1 Tax=Trichogramma kaykai TaxID=54128 RepID=A0ABD2XFI7_9HYME
MKNNEINTREVAYMTRINNGFVRPANNSVNKINLITAAAYTHIAAFCKRRSTSCAAAYVLGSIDRVAGTACCMQLYVYVVQARIYVFHNHLNVKVLLLLLPLLRLLVHFAKLGNFVKLLHADEEPGLVLGEQRKTISLVFYSMQWNFMK